MDRASIENDADESDLGADLAGHPDGLDTGEHGGCVVVTSWLRPTSANRTQRKRLAGPLWLPPEECLELFLQAERDRPDDGLIRGLEPAEAARAGDVFDRLRLGE